MNSKSPEEMSDAELAYKTQQAASDNFPDIEPGTEHTPETIEKRRHAANIILTVSKCIRQLQFPQTRSKARAKFKELLEWLPNQVARCQPLYAKIKRKKKKKRKISFAAADEFYESAPQSTLGPFLDTTELGNAWRLSDILGGSALYVREIKKWFKWDGSRWNSEIGQKHVEQKAMTLHKYILEEYERARGDDMRKALKKWAKESQKRRIIDDTISLASRIKRIAVEVRDFDKNPWLLNCLNGTIDLQTGHLRDHNLNDMITKLCPVDYQKSMDKSIRYELWYEFLDYATDRNKALQNYLQKVIGYSLTGQATLDKIFFVWGDARTGKTTLLMVLNSILGDYSKMTSFKTFLKSKSGPSGHRADVAALAGARIVIASEVGKYGEFDEELISAIAGGDAISASFKYGQPFTFIPQCAIWLAANFKPKITYTAKAVWERMDLIPFTHFIPVNKRDPTVRENLSNPKKAGPTILHWAVRGCLAWQENPRRIKPPIIVKQATQEYREEMDPVKTFFEDCCRFSGKCCCVRAVLYERYKKYCEENGIDHPLNQRQFNEVLEAKGCAKNRKVIQGKQEKVWFGVEISN